MSFKVFTWVLEHSEARLADRLVLLTLAEHADDDGTKAFPKQQTIIRKARLSERQVSKSLQALKAKGAIVETGTTRRGVKVYSVVMTKEAAALKGVQNLRGAESAGAKSAGQPPQSLRDDPAESAGATNKGFEPSTNQPSEPSRQAGGPTAEEAPLSHLLADLIAANDPDGSRPRVGKTWAEAERLLQERDGRSAAQIESLIRWCQSDAFEHTVVLSMPKLRHRYRQLLAKAGKTGGAPTPVPDFVDG